MLKQKTLFFARNIIEELEYFIAYTFFIEDVDFPLIFSIIVLPLPLLIKVGPW